VDGQANVLVYCGKAHSKQQWWTEWDWAGRPMCFFESSTLAVTVWVGAAYARVTCDCEYVFNLVQAASATVVRNSRLQQVPAADLVPGDVVELAGEQQQPAAAAVASGCGSSSSSRGSSSSSRGSSSECLQLIWCLEMLWS
jgi:hypothetical protein